MLVSTRHYFMIAKKAAGAEGEEQNRYLTRSHGLWYNGASDGLGNGQVT